MNFSRIDFRNHPELYRSGRGEQGVLLVEPYKSEILPHWQFRTPGEANRSSSIIYKLFLAYLRQSDFPGADMARKFLQMGWTRARRYANHKSGRKYKRGTTVVLPRMPDAKKAASAKIFYEKYVKARANKRYLRLKKMHEQQFFSNLQNSATMNTRIGIAGWSFPKRVEEFGDEGTHLDRYATRFNAVEINSSFYRPHRRSTYERWGANTPVDFKFAVKMPKQITHANRLVGIEHILDEFLDQIQGLGKKLGPVLVQLPPSLSWDEDRAKVFFKQLRLRYSGDVVCETRHHSWFEAKVSVQFKEFQIQRVFADPSPIEAATTSLADSESTYFRLHGSPRIYYSSYDDEFLHCLAKRIARSKEVELWCIFDNTAENAAVNNSLYLQSLLSHDSGTRQERH